METKTEKYVKPGSLTWWMGALSIMGSLVLFSEPLHGMSALIQTINNITSNANPSALLYAGLTIIGFRGAMPTAEKGLI